MLKTKQWLTLQAACEYIGPRRGRQATAVGTVRLWIKRGLMGIRLQAQYRGSILMTTADYIEEFFEKVSQAKVRKRRLVDLPTPTQRKLAQQRAKAELERMGAR